MKIREHIEKNEKYIFCDRASLSSKTLGRDVYEKSCDLRTEYQRDRDRILHSKAFRRLKRKTQVFLSPEGDHYRTRLTHTLEVSQIARTVARGLRINEDLVEAIAMGHDLGHTPFGHSGEEALNIVCPHGFRHYEQSKRIVERLEKDGLGLNLTRETRDGILNHGYGNWPKTLEGRIVRVCDKVAYINHDIDDAIRACKLSQNNLPEKFSELVGTHYGNFANMMVNSIIKNTDGNMPKMDSETQSVFDEIHEFMYRWIYQNKHLKTEELKIPKVIRSLYSFFKKNFKKMPDQIQDIAKKDGIDRAVSDYISGMTDDFAVNIYKDIFVPKFFSFY